MGCITKLEQDNYDFFVNTICARRIPVLLVVTGCENLEPMSLWQAATRNSSTIKD